MVTRDTAYDARTLPGWVLKCEPELGGQAGRCDKPRAEMTVLGQILDIRHFDIRYSDNRHSQSQFRYTR
jgi:hypothetical protein